MKVLHPVLLSAVAGFALLSPAFAAPKVVTSIKPLHSLVSMVMGDIAEPDVIVKGAQSPHDYALAPSQAKALQEADIVFWVGHELEAFLDKSIETIAQQANSVELIDTKGLQTLEFRENGIFDDHKEEGHEGDAHGDHDDHEAEGEHEHEEAHHDEEHDHEEKHAEDEHHDDDMHEDNHAHEEHQETEHSGIEQEDDHDGHDHAHHDGLDPHIWLDPENAKILVTKITDVLVEADPENADTYRANQTAALTKLGALLKETKTALKPAQNQPYVVFHDGYQYFENRFHLSPAGALTINVESAPGAQHIRNIQNEIKKRGAKCVFSEPQFSDRLVAAVAEGTNLKTATLDPLGATIDEGPELYFQLIRNMTGAIQGCLSEPS